MINLYDYQKSAELDALNFWNQGGKAYLIVMPTGGGKSLTMAHIVQSHGGHVVVFAHRDVILEQLCGAFAKFGINHHIYAAKGAVAAISTNQVAEFGRSYSDETASLHICSVDTFRSHARRGVLPDWVKYINLVVVDEGHHLLKNNKWGECVQALPDESHLLTLTATPERADNKGIGIHSHGFIEAMHIAPTTRDLIHAGFLCDFRVMAPPNAAEIAGKCTELRATATGDYNNQAVASLVDTLKIVGDVVYTVAKHAPGKQGIVFATNIKHSVHLAAGFNDAGISAVSLSSKTPAGERRQNLADFRAGKIKVLCNVDLFGEGFDVAGIEFISMCRPTLSYSLFVQQFGRALRIMKGKTVALIFDHVGNSLIHGLPDNGKEWDINPPKRRKNNTTSLINTTTCTNVNCLSVYRIPARCCPYCAQIPAITERREYQTESGELVELSPEIIQALQREKNRIDISPEQIYQAHLRSGKPSYIARGIANRHEKRQTAQYNLRQTVLNWHLAHFGGNQDNNIIFAQQQFERLFGVDVHKMQTLNAKQSDQLTSKILCL